MIKPGCFGSFVLFGLNGEFCSKCNFNGECAVKAKQNEALVKARFKCTDRLPRETSAGGVKIPYELIDVDSLPKKAKPIAVKLIKSIEEIKSLMNEEKPVVLKPLFMQVALNRLRGGFTKRELKEIYMTRFGWSDGTAAAHVSMAIAIIEKLRFGRADGKGVYAKV